MTHATISRIRFSALPRYRAWFTADTASATGAALRTLALSLVGYAVSDSVVAAGWLRRRRLRRSA